MHCGRATPTEPGVPPRLASTGAIEVAKVTRALAGQYQIERVIGEGGMATVYLADDRKHKRKVAVKVMRPELAATLGADRFLREVQIAAQLSHPHILPMYDSGESGGMLYYVMPLVEGESLRERIVRDGALPPNEALRYAREVAEALSYAHGRGFIHRDIKPANVLLSAGHALVADFGIARAVDEGGGESLTRTGLAMGTPQYMAPEQAMGEKDVDARADVYAVGAVLYEMLSGEAPFSGTNSRAILTRSLTEMPKPVSSVRQELSPALDEIVLRALAKSPADRYPSAAALVAAIDALRDAPRTPVASVAATPAGAEEPSPYVSAGALPSVPRAAAATAPQDTPAEPSAATRPGVPPAAQQGTPPAAAPVPRASWFSPRNLVVAALVVAVAVLALRRTGTSPAAPDSRTPRGNRLAVLPFNGEGAGVEPYLYDGIAEDVRAKLAEAQALTVIGSASVDEYRKTTKSPAEIGSELTADYLLSAAVRSIGDAGRGEVAVQPKLIDARSGKVLWEQSIEANEATGGLPGLPSAVATGVVGALHLAVKPTEQAEIAKAPTGNAEAYRTLLRGRRQWLAASSDPSMLRGAVQELEQAVAIDSTYVEAWARLAMATTALYSNGNKDPLVSKRSKEAVDRAVSLDPGRTLVRRARSGYLTDVLADKAAAAAELDRALRAAPNDGALLSSSAGQDMGAGDLGSALSKLERALQLDPRSGAILNSVVQLYTYLGRAADAKAAGVTLLAVRPQNLTAIQAVAIAYLSVGELEGARGVLRGAVQRGVAAPRLAVQMAGFQEMGWALEEAQQQLLIRLNASSFDGDRAWWGQTLATLHWQRGDTVRARAYADSAIAPTREQLAGAPGDPQVRGLLALMLAYQGKANEARSEVKSSVALADRYVLTAYNLVNAAKTELALGNRDEAVGYLRSARERGYYVTDRMLQLDPTYASLKGYPAFEAMLKGQ